MSMTVLKPLGDRPSMGDKLHGQIISPGYIQSGGRHERVNVYPDGRRKEPGREW